MERKKFDFKPFQKVLVRDRGLWKPAFFSHKSSNGEKCYCINDQEDYWEWAVIPYEGYEDYLNTYKRLPWDTY